MQYLTAKLIAASLMAALSVPAIAERDGPRGIKRMDTDGDGFISMEEFRFPGDRLLKGADADDNGSISSDELAAAQSRMAAKMQERMAQHQEKAQERFTAADTDRDGAVTSEESKAYAFSQLDEDGDGYISREEFRRKMADGPRGPRGKFRGKDRPRRD